MKTRKRSSRWWGHVLTFGVPAALLLSLVCWLFSGSDEDECWEEFRRVSAEYGKAIEGYEPNDDYARINRQASAGLAASIRADLKQLEDERLQLQQMYSNVQPFFPGGDKPVLIDTQEDADQYIRQRDEVNQRLADLEKKKEAVVARARNSYQTFQRQGKTGKMQGAEPGIPRVEGLDGMIHRDSAGRPQYLTSGELQALDVINAYRPRLMALKKKFRDQGCDRPAREAQRKLDELDALEADIEELAEKRRIFYESNVQGDTLVAKEELRGTTETERFNLCLAPQDALTALEAFELPQLEPLSGELLVKSKAMRHFSAQEADFCIASTADIGPGLLRPLIISWAGSKNIPYVEFPDGNGEATPENNSQNWVVLKGAASMLSGKGHEAPFEDEYWIYIMPIGSGDSAGACLQQGGRGADIVVTGEYVPDSSMRDSHGLSRRYDPQSMMRLCSDAVLFIDQTGASHPALEYAQVTGQAKGDRQIKRIFFPQGTPQRSITDIFSLRPVAGKDVELADGDTSAALGRRDEGALIIPRHLCPKSATAYAFALPAIKSNGKEVTSETNKLARPGNAACYPDEDRIRSHDYMLSYDINMFRQSDKAFVKTFFDFCGTPAAQACVRRCGYVPLKGDDELQFGRLTAEDLPVAVVISKLNEAGSGLGYKEGDTCLYGVRLSNVAFFETNRTDPKEGVVFDFAHGKALSETIEHLLANGIGGKGYAIVVIGHADIRGGDEYNIKLSEQRACSAVENMLYTVPSKDKLCKPQCYVKKSAGGNKGGVQEILYHNAQEKISLVTVGCGYWRPLSSNDAREKAAEVSKSDPGYADTLLRNDRRVEFFIIVPKK